MQNERWIFKVISLFSFWIGLLLNWLIRKIFITAEPVSNLLLIRRIKVLEKRFISRIDGVYILSDISDIVSF